jgi:VWFA-related protein
MAAVPFGRKLHDLRGTLRAIFLAGLSFFVVRPTAPAQVQSEVPTTTQSGSAAHSPNATIKMRVNLVLVRVVVRDNNGKLITGLQKEDFQITDERKPQIISSFSVESRASQVSAVKMDSAEPVSAGTAAKVVELPQRFVTLFFDDLHLSAQDVVLSKQAATKLLAAMGASERYAVFTTSGQVEQDFTADRENLKHAIDKIMPRFGSSMTDCPSMNFYEAYQIAEVNDGDALAAAIQDYNNCAGTSQSAKLIVQGMAQRELHTGEAQLHFTYQNLESVIRRMSTLNGQRVIALMSPGFFVTPTMHKAGEIIDRATKANVVINSIDARGLYVSSIYDASVHTGFSPQKMQLVTAQERIQDDPLAELADGTGGTFFHNRNDIDQGLLQAAAEPDTSYVLGFAPENLKFDGKYHQLKVTLTNKQKWAIQARRGYFAPLTEANPATTANDEIQQALHTQAELHDIPVEYQTQLTKTANGSHLSLGLRVDVQGLPFRKADSVSSDDLAVAAAVFDNNGNLLTCQQKVLQLRLKDATLEQIQKQGLRVDFAFDLKPGAYLLRIVVRDSEGAQMSATNRGVQIP